MTPEEKDRIIFHKLDKLETHLINLNYSLQSINSFFSDKNSREDISKLMRQIFSSPLQINERPFREVRADVERLNDKLHKFNNFLEKFNLETTYGEIKFIGKKINEIKLALEKIQKDGIKRNIDLNFSCDGYTLVKADPVNKELSINHILSWDKVLDCLPDINKRIIIKRLGLADGKPLSYKEIGRQLGIAGQGASHHYQRGLRKLRTVENLRNIARCDSEALKQAVGCE